ncbi:MAG: nicotinate-nicotinamide nucleotide adenylyltransferase [Promethearchaeota archaeon]|jgi:nicotinate-nucleotide adenylyltransferase
MPLSNHVAIFGGSFDPPHIGHEIATLWLISALNAPVVEIVPTFEHCFGKKLTDFNHRYEMCRLMFSKYDGLSIERSKYSYDIYVNDIEKQLPKPNITYNLIKTLMADPDYKENKFAVIVGSDLVPELHKWERWNEVADMVKVVALGRSGFENAKTPLKVYQYPIELSAISSSEIRDKIARGESITGLVPHRVEEYIYANNLYA